jgi:hypothetical protein
MVVIAALAPRRATTAAGLITVGPDSILAAARQRRRPSRPQHHGARHEPEFMTYD